MDINKLERMGRRRFVENLVGIGVSASTLEFLDQKELSDITHDPEEEIPYVSRKSVTSNGFGVESTACI